MTWASRELHCVPGRRPAFGKIAGVEGGGFFVQVGQNFLDDRGGVDAADDLEGSLAAGQVSMSMAKTRFGRCAHVMAA